MRRSTLLFPPCGSTCPLYPPPRDHITSDRAKSSRPRFSGSRPSTNIPLVLGYVRKQVARQSESSRILRGARVSKTFMITTTCRAKERLRSNREVLKNSDNKLHGKKIVASEEVKIHTFLYFPLQFATICNIEEREFLLKAEPMISTVRLIDS